MSRFIVVTEKVAGTRTVNYAVKDTSINHVGYRTLDKDKAEDVATKANLLQQSAEE